MTGVISGALLWYVAAVPAKMTLREIPINDNNRTGWFFPAAFFDPKKFHV